MFSAMSTAVIHLSSTGIQPRAMSAGYRCEETKVNAVLPLFAEATKNTVQHKNGLTENPFQNRKDFPADSNRILLNTQV